MRLKVGASQTLGSARLLQPHTEASPHGILPDKEPPPPKIQDFNPPLNAGVISPEPLKACLMNLQGYYLCVQAACVCVHLRA